LPDPSEPVRSYNRLALTLLFTGLVAVSWTGTLETSAETALQSTLSRALVTAAVARGLNGVISVAQGTELAIQPVGIGVTISAGQILDPLNDLVERFSWLALAASASLGTQMLLTQVFAEPAVNVALTAVVAAYLAVLWWPRPVAPMKWLLRLAAFIIFLRFVFTSVTLLVGWVDHWVLEERQALAMSQLTQATATIEALEGRSADPLTTPDSLLQRFESAIDGSRQAFDIQTRLNTLKTRVEESINHLIDLMVLFLVQTLVLPLGAFYLALACFRAFWRWSFGSPHEARL
jgi:hypothetical protein